MLGMAIAHRGAEMSFRANRKSNSEDHRPESFVWIEQHTAGKSRNQASRRKFRKFPRLPVKRNSRFRARASTQSRNIETTTAVVMAVIGVAQDCFESQYSVPNYIPNDHEAGEIPEREQTGAWILVRIDRTVVLKPWFSSHA